MEIFWKPIYKRLPLRERAKMNDSRDPPWTLETVATKPAAMTTRFLLLNHFFLKQLQKHIFKKAKKETKERKP